MAQFLNFGNGTDGYFNVNSPTTYLAFDSICSGSLGDNVLNVPDRTFVAGQYILIHQSRGVGNAGKFEINLVASYASGNITTAMPLSDTYTSSGDYAAQVIAIPQYSGVNINSNLIAKSWNGSVGGIIPILCNGVIDISGTVTAESSGYLGGAGRTNNSGNVYAFNGENISATSTATSNISNGGGGGFVLGAAVDDFASGGGGSHATVGTNGNSQGLSSAGVGATTIIGQADLSSGIFFGGGGGGGMADINTSVGRGGNGGGIILIYAKEVRIGSSAIISVNGGAGAGAAASGAGGAAGTIIIRCITAMLDINKLVALGGVGGIGSNRFGTNISIGGNGGNGRIRVEACSLTGSTNPTMSSQTGGFSYCQSGLNFIM